MSTKIMDKALAAMSEAEAGGCEMSKLEELEQRNRDILLTYEGEHLSCHDADELIIDLLTALRESEAKNRALEVMK